MSKGSKLLALNYEKLDRQLKFGIDQYETWPFICHSLTKMPISVFVNLTNNATRPDVKVIRPSPAGRMHDGCGGTRGTAGNLLVRLEFGGFHGIDLRLDHPNDTLLGATVECRSLQKNE